jgi:hypothetical protein
MSWNLFIAAAAVTFSVISYLVTRRRELAWRRTEFLCSQMQQLDNDPVLVEAVTILEDRHPTITVADVFSDDDSLDLPKRAEYRQKFDKLLNFLWRLCYAYSTLKTISRAEVEGFGWYFWRLSRVPVLVAYCENNGYEGINNVVRELKLDQNDDDLIETSVVDQLKLP